MSGYENLARMETFRPLERPVACEHRTAPFSAPWTSTVALLAKELRAHGARGCVLEIDFSERNLRLDGLPRADRSARTPAIVLSFDATRVPGRPHLRYEVGTFRDWRDNLRAVALGLEALRAVDRYGVTKRGEQYAGWRALPMPSGEPSAERGRQLIARHGSVAAALKATHPDHGGADSDFRAVQAAREVMA